MKWVDRFDLFLFDLDGLLVDTESFHYKAYKKGSTTFFEGGAPPVYLFLLGWGLLFVFWGIKLLNDIF